jgi:ABC-type nitrate/sulfonate/bicarbonate transport system substrate-binding protein
MSTTTRPAGRRLTSIAVLAASFAFVAAACSSSGSTAAPTTAATEAPSAAATEAPSASAGAVACTPEAGTFRMGTEPWLGYGPWWVAEDKELFAQNGLDVKVSSFTTDDEINAALAAGQIDGANIATHTAMRLAQAGTPLTAVLVLDQSNTADAALAAAPVASIADLKGKKVAYEEGTTSDILLRYALSQNGMTIDDIVKVPTSAADAGTAAIAKRVDAAVTYEPYLTAALQQDPSFKLIYTADEKPGLISDVGRRGRLLQQQRRRREGDHLEGRRRDAGGPEDRLRRREDLRPRRGEGAHGGRLPEDDDGHHEDRSRGRDHAGRDRPDDHPEHDLHRQGRPVDPARRASPGSAPPGGAAEAT